MIKKVSLIKRFNDKFSIPVDLIKFNPSLNIDGRVDKFDYLIGGFYQNMGYSICAFYASDENGNILSEIPIIHEDGVNTYFDLFKLFGYTFL